MGRLGTVRAGPWAVIACLWVVVAAMNAYYIVPSSVLPVIMERLGIGPTAASLLVSVTFGTQVVVGVPVGIVLDRIDDRRAIVAAGAVLVGAYVWSWRAAASGAFHSLLAARALATPLTAAIWTASIGVVGRQFPAERRATAVAAITSAPPAGFAVALVAAPVVTDRLGWATVFVVFAAPVAVGCAAFLLASRRLDLSGRDGATPSVGDLGTLLSDRSIWIVSALAFLGFSLYAFVTSWTPTYLAERLDVSLAYGGLFAALFPAIGAFARGGSGFVSDRLFAHRRRPVALLSFSVAAPAIVLIAAVEMRIAVVGSLLLAGLFVQLGLGLFYAQVREIAAPNVVATAVGITTSTAVLGGFVAPLIGGFLIERSGYAAAFGYAVVVALLGSVLAWFTPEPDL